MIETEGISKSFNQGFIPRKMLALDDLNLKVNQGEVFGYLGPNGAGKTTTIKILMNLIYPDKGEAWVMGEDVRRVNARHQIGFLPDQPYFYDYLTGREFLDFCARLLGMRKKEREHKIDDLLDLLGLSHAGDLQLWKYSRGMLQRIGLAQALINDPNLLILDEPLSGLDPIGRKELRDLILKLKDEGKTVFFSSHILSDAELISDRVGILVKGKLMAVGKLEELLGKGVKYVEIIASLADAKFLPALEQISLKIFPRNGQMIINIEQEDDIMKVIKLVEEGSGRIFSVVPQKQTLEDIFIQEMEKK